MNKISKKIVTFVVAFSILCGSMFVLQTNIARAAEPCSHTGYIYNIPISYQYKSQGSGGHSVLYKYETLCIRCYKHFRYGEDLYIESHTYGSNGRCTKCNW